MATVVAQHTERSLHAQRPAFSWSQPAYTDDADADLVEHDHYMGPSDRHRPVAVLDPNATVHLGGIVTFTKEFRDDRGCVAN